MAKGVEGLLEVRHVKCEVIELVHEPLEALERLQVAHIPRRCQCGQQLQHWSLHLLTCVNYL